MPEERFEDLLDQARRHVAEAEAKLARQRDLVAAAVVRGQYASVLIEAWELRSLGTTLVLMRDQLRIAEQRR